MNEKFENKVTGSFDEETIICERTSLTEVICRAVETESDELVRFRVIKYSDGWGITSCKLKAEETTSVRLTTEHIPEWVWNASEQIERLVEEHLDTVN